MWSNVDGRVRSMSLYNVLKKPYHRLVPYSVRRFIFRITPKPLKSIKGHIVRSLEKSAQHDEIYDEQYYMETFIKHEPEKARSCAAIAESIVEAFNPKTVVDVGCGTGFLLAALGKCGVHSRGLEYSEAAIYICLQRGLHVIRFDLEHDVLLEDFTADVVISTEVAEHLPASCADRFVDILCAIAKNVVLTAAQHGPCSNVATDHVNEQPKEYWINKFEVRGFGYDECLSTQWSADWKASNVVPWYVENLMVFRKVAST
jgi:SAM-dependent methyltransferase